MDQNLKMPGGEMASRPLHFFWVVDCSGSMYGSKIDEVNHAIQECIQPMRDDAANNPNAQLYVRTLKFSTGASWVTADPVRIEDFFWEDLNADGITDMGKAFDMIASQLEMPPMPARALPPVIVLLSDGMPTDDWKRPLEKLKNMPWGIKAVRVAIAIGKDADKTVLETFTGNKEMVLNANNPETLTHFIKWASTLANEVSRPAIEPTVELNENPSGTADTKPQEESATPPNNISLPDMDNISDAEDVW